MSLAAAAPPIYGQPAPAAPSTARPPATPAVSPAGSGAQASDGQQGSATSHHAEVDRYLTIRKLLDADRLQKSALDDELKHSESDFAKFSDELAAADARLNAAREAQTTPGSVKDKSPENDPIALQGQFAKIRDRLQRIIDRRKAVVEQLETLAEKIPLETELLDSIVHIGPTADKPLPAPASAPSPAPPSPAAAQPAPALTSTSIFIPGGLPASSAPSSEATVSSVDQFDPRLIAARKRWEQSQATLEAAQHRLALLTRTIAVFERDIKSTEDLLETAKEGLKVAEQSAPATPSAGAQPGAPDAAQHARWVERARSEVERQSDRLKGSEVALDHFRTARDRAIKSVAEVEAQSKTAHRELVYLESPLSPQRLEHWFTDRAPRILFILLGTAALWWFTQLVGKRLVAGLIGRTSKGNRAGSGTEAERHSRAETLRRVFQSFSTVTVVVLGTLGALHAAGIDVTVLLGGAAVLGAALAFGSQNLIKDYFSGFMMLVENQFSVGNVVRIGDITGTVEDVTMRVTVLRDLEGVVHFIPHSEADKISNLTYGWSRQVFDVRVGPAEDPDRVMKLLMDVARELKSDHEHGAHILEEPQMLGVDSVSGAGTVIKFLVKARPANRWIIKREMLRRIKKTFDAQGIKLA